MGSRSPQTPKGESVPVRAGKKAPRDLTCKLETGRGRERVVRAGLAVLTDDELRFRTGRTGRDGRDFHVHLRYDELTSIVLEPHGAVLALTTDGGELYKLHLGKHAPAWKELLETRPSPVDVFGISAGMRVAVDFMPDEEIAAHLEACSPGAASVPHDTLGLDALFVGADHPADLKRVPEHARRIKKPGGALWVVHPVGPRGLPADQVVAAGRAIGLATAGTVVLSRAHEAIHFGWVT